MGGHSATRYAEARPDKPPLEPLLTINEVAAVLSISRDKVYVLMRSGALQPIRVGHHARFDPQDVRDYIEHQREERTA
jgi:excisionase family DNA binding protein